ncbi:phosphate signaling complex PhoU family protein [Mycoplasmopsis columbinasalis]|uniref:Phosphate transport system protein PhoU n=1 Tax=Mycoplasmopsis columbinasalis TaxID=114880 RepID=A0A449BAT6_9BACT|nr:PhoU domain-containing protein [Mycoplasmopsis columbinasalis]VEU78312.1 Phosphate transport system protein PhoU [Mycoplasmopsis columbinasalis]
MSVNYSLLKKSEENLKEFFYSYISHSIKMHDQVLSLIEKARTKDETIHDAMKTLTEMENFSDHVQVDNVNELLWDLSKDQPMLDHLRWYICVLNSLGDIERINDYLFFLGKFFTKYHHMMSTDTLEIAVTLNQKLNELFHNFLKYARRKQASKFFEVFQKEKNDYKVFCDKKIEELALKLEQEKINIQIIIKLSFELHSHYRIVERMENILENLVFINEPEYFQKKLSQNEQI